MTADNQKVTYLRSEYATPRFSFKGQGLEASKAIEPVIEAFESLDTAKLPARMSVALRKRLTSEIDTLKAAGIRRVIRITGAGFCSADSSGSAGFAKWIDVSREWRECEIVGSVLERYIKVDTGECIWEAYDENALITFHQSRHVRNSSEDGDWQLDSFCLDMHQGSLLNDELPTDTGNAVGDQLKEAAAGAAIGTINAAGKAVEMIADAWDYMDEERLRYSSSNEENDNYLGAVILIVILVVLLIVTLIFALPRVVRIALGVAAIAAVIWGILKYRKVTDQDRKRKQIIRYSDGYLRSCIGDIMQSRPTTSNRLNISIDDISIASVSSDEHTTTIEVPFTLVTKTLESDGSIGVTAENTSLKLRRSRYPEKKRKKAKLEVDICPDCGTPFQPDDHKCCSNCGYGIKLQNFVWREVNGF